MAVEHDLLDLVAGAAAAADFLVQHRELTPGAHLACVGHRLATVGLASASTTPRTASLF